jgi:hypothetical protein
VNSGGEYPFTAKTLHAVPRARGKAFVRQDVK